MTDSSFPVKPAAIGQNPQAEAQKPNVRLTALPSELNDVKKPIRISGEVKGVKPDGTATIRTGQGDIEVQIRDARLQRVIQQGQQIEIQIPAGRPPREAQVAVQPENMPAPAPQQAPVDIVTIKPSPPPVQTPQPQAQTQAPTSAPKPEQQVQVTVLAPDAPVPSQPVAIENIPIEQILPLLKAEAIVQIIQQTLPQAPLPADMADMPLPETPVTTFPASKPPAITIADVIKPEQPLNLSPLPAPETNTPAASVNLIKPALPVFNIFNISLYEGEENVKIPQAAALPAPAILADINNLFPAQPVQTIMPSEPAATSIPQAPITMTAVQIPIPDLPLQTPQIINVEKPAIKMVEQFFAEQSSPLILENQKAGEHTAMIIGKTEQNFPVILTAPTAKQPPQAFILQMPFETITPGTQITFMVNDTMTAPITINMPSQPISAAPSLLPSFMSLEPQAWPLITQIMTTLAGIAPQSAQAMMNMTPSPANPSQMGAAAMFFIAAIRSGDISSWLGEKSIEALRRSGNSNLLSRLSQEGGAINRLTTDSAAQDWRSMPLPFFMDNEMHKIALHYKNDDDARQNKDEKGGIRFIFDLTFDQIGPVQLDALFKPGRLDVILRTENSFASNMQQEMRDLYANALRQTQITGELLFQDQPQQWVKVNAENKNQGVRI